MENRNGLAVAGKVSEANGTAERRTAESLLKKLAKPETMTLLEKLSDLPVNAKLNEAKPLGPVGMLMAMGRLNRPSLFVYGGTILPGEHQGRDVDLVNIFEAVGKNAAGQCPAEEVEALVATGRTQRRNVAASSVRSTGLAM